MRCKGKGLDQKRVRFKAEWCCIYGNIELSNHQCDAAFDELWYLRLVSTKMFYLHRCYSRAFPSMWRHQLQNAGCHDNWLLVWFRRVRCYVANSFLCSALFVLRECTQAFHIGHFMVMLMRMEISSFEFETHSNAKTIIYVSTHMHFNGGVERLCRTHKGNASMKK